MDTNETLIRTMAARLEQLEAEVRSLRAERPAATATTSSDGAAFDLGAPASRRDLLRRSAVVAGAAAATVATVGVKPAAAADDDHLLVGSTVEADTATGLFSDTAQESRNVLTVSARFGGITAALYPSAIGGYAHTGNQFNGFYALVNHDDISSTKSEGYGLVSSVTNPGTNSRAQLWLEPSGDTPEDDVIKHFAGEVRVDESNRFWICTETGTPGVWQNLNLAIQQAQDSTATLTPSFFRPPQRAFDTRAISEPTGNGPAAKGKLGKKETRKVKLGHVTDVPGAARQLLVTVTVRNGAAAGTLSLYESGIARPPFGVVSWTGANQVVTAQVVVGCNDAQEVKVRSTVACDVSIDVTAYYSQVL